MKRVPTRPRDNWQKIVESQGFYYHTPEGKPYWDESAYYQFSASEVDVLEAATYELDKLCLAAVDHVLKHPELLGRLQIPEQWYEPLCASWERDENSIVGRFDLAYDGSGPPKLIEYNADTPTALLEAAVVQWYWQKDCFPQADQFNSLHERLIEAWKHYLPSMHGKMMYFSSLDDMEDFMTVSYLQDTAVQAGLDARYIQCEDIGWHPVRKVFTDLDENQIHQIFKLYPWEWLMRDQFAEQVRTSSTKWLEPPWKMLLNNKAILPVLWELFPEHPNLLAASFEPMDEPFVRKPVLGREGSNVYIQIDRQTFASTPGTYGAPFVYQRYHPLANFGGHHALIGSWMVNGYASGIGIREDSSLITGNLSRFVPHLFT